MTRYIATVKTTIEKKALPIDNIRRLTITASNKQQVKRSFHKYVNENYVDPEKWDDKHSYHIGDDCLVKLTDIVALDETWLTTKEIDGLLRRV